MNLIPLMFHLIQIDNEENALICLRILIELHKQHRPEFNSKILQFITFVKGIYTDLPGHLCNIFKLRMLPIHIDDLNDINIDKLLQETYILTQINIGKKYGDKDNLVIDVSI